MLLRSRNWSPKYMQLGRPCPCTLIVLWAWAMATAIAWAGEPTGHATPEGPGRNAWYWNSPVNIHWDNHGSALGKGMTVEEITRLFAGLKVDMIQVSACSG